mmetsp:Transcript_62746/g.181882  ORF Transcript_62746/g.181882 Transcript_62746/m.181882 type:complete len:271 (-) Transcript_62746:3-815(-)
MSEASTTGRKRLNTGSCHLSGTFGSFGSSSSNSGLIAPSLGRRALAADAAAARFVPATVASLRVRRAGRGGSRSFVPGSSSESRGPAPEDGRRVNGLAPRSTGASCGRSAVLPRSSPAMSKPCIHLEADARPRASTGSPPLEGRRTICGAEATRSSCRLAYESTGALAATSAAAPPLMPEVGVEGRLLLTPRLAGRLPISGSFATDEDEGNGCMGVVGRERCASDDLPDASACRAPCGCMAMAPGVTKAPTIAAKGPATRLKRLQAPRGA